MVAHPNNQVAPHRQSRSFLQSIESALAVSIAASTSTLTLTKITTKTSTTDATSKATDALVSPIYLSLLLSSHVCCQGAVLLECSCHGRTSPSRSRNGILQDTTATTTALAFPSIKSPYVVALFASVNFTCGIGTVSSKQRGSL